ncbi:PLP-dependent aminotransferase family protein [Siccirubricoccus sp. KC 17139]|uniref:PLP-dependent aminotransferase family protein n=1 Tax=Siccirubricoccus soli TaxID=2899147 RepID=A0ABT1D4L8_9PROT|nr:PLP-dependent aminotransferase family protein [Siccirubricoccus soli]MCO6416868.1 PLP-dependent aminotransferase family protein [Siccirubricoccus soli]MCP2683003.1 PLP-dependent aminotransferase family protein [Siccirubricoccus soli]
MSVWTPRLAPGAGPIYLAIAEAIAAAIVRGELRPGERLPTHRALAEALGVDLTTVTRAYAEARRRGLVEAVVGRGTFIRAASSTPAATAGKVDLTMNLPPMPAELPGLLQRGLARLLAEGDPAELLTYRRGAGALAERAAGAAWLSPVLPGLEPDRVLLSPGAQPALLAVLGLLAAPGELVLTEQLTYPGLRNAAARLRLRLHGLPGDAAGLLPEALEAACRTLRPRALYCIPTLQNPMAVTLPPERRHAIADIARRHGLPILEDDAYGLLPARPLPALASLAPELVWHVSTLAKLLSPALRLAYVAAPDAAAAGRLAAALRANVLMPSPLLSGLATGWMEDGTAARLRDAVRAEAMARQALARDILPAALITAPPEGLHLWLRLPAPWGRRDFIARLREERGLAVVPSDAFAPDPAVPPPDAVRLSLGAAPGRAALREALQAVAAMLGAAVPAELDVV